MDTRTGQIYDEEELKRMFGDGRLSKKDKKFFKPMPIPPTDEQLKRRPPRVGRNDPCPCGSGLKFKRCCLNSEDDAAEETQNDE